MRRLVLFLFLFAAALVMAYRFVGDTPFGDNGIVAAWLPVPEGLAVVRANHDRPDFEFDAGRGNVELRSSRTVAELKRSYQDLLRHDGFVVIDGMHRVIVADLTLPTFALYACHRSKGRFLNIVGSRHGRSAETSAVNLVYWESRDLALVEGLFGLMPGERPCSD